MPGFDGNGPDFGGPMTGWARGVCAGDGVPFGSGRGCGLGRGRGRRQGAGWGNPDGRGRPMARRAGQPPTNVALIQLERQAAAMQRNLEAVHQRIRSLKAGPTEMAPPATDGEE